MQPKAFSYLRFSTPEQMKGDSFRRQTALAEEYVHRHGLALDTELTFRDLGVSAFRGRNARTGALGAFLRAVDDGLVPEGSFLLVESLDRVTRQDPWEALPVFQQVINAGVTIVTLQDGKTYSRAELRENPFRLMESLFVMVRAHEESATKARRLKAAWVGKRAKAQEKPLTSRVPAWIELDKASGAFHLIPDRAAVVQRIFAMAAEGAGQHRIAETLNREGVPTFGDNGTKRRAGMWHRSYVAKILGSPAAGGTLVPHQIEHGEGGRKVRKPLEALDKYYPAAVDAELFQRVQAMQGGEGIAPVVRGGADGASVRSLLAGLAKCPLCGGSMTRVAKGKRSKPVLVCAKAKAGAGCEYVSVHQDAVERTIIGNVGLIAGTMPSGDDTLDGTIANAETARDALGDAIENVLRAIERGEPSPTLTARLRELEGQREAMDAELRELHQRAMTVSTGAVLRRLDELDRLTKADPMDPAKVNAVLRQTFNAVVVDFTSGSLRLEWKQGGETGVTYGWPRERGEDGWKLAG
ncbi:recombinase family protein [Roseicella aquatilis]|uniref:Recombinase family protein n=1 Tax=Roseicella aquatilis TaxID=2527868 RepID=A0A4R4D6S8_9PROT|nr:recombinase family protein [Roseicella aquatilis]TCZ55429.1 recombinase family protein [Roseicella aquatilis]